jgi:hypothetical protein
MQKTKEEIAEMNPAELKEYQLDQQKVVFGHDHKIDKHGNPIEQGIGSDPANRGENHYQSIRKYEGVEAERAARARDAALAKACG